MERVRNSARMTRPLSASTYQRSLDPPPSTSTTLACSSPTFSSPADLKPKASSPACCAMKMMSRLMFFRFSSRISAGIGVSPSSVFMVPDCGVRTVVMVMLGARITTYARSGKTNVCSTSSGISPCGVRRVLLITCLTDFTCRNLPSPPSAAATLAANARPGASEGGPLVAAGFPAGASGMEISILFTLPNVPNSRSKSAALPSTSTAS